MRGLVAALAAGTLLVASTTSEAALNLLVNPGFETPSAAGGDVTTPGSGWSGWNNWVAPYSAYITAAVAHSGAQSGKTFSGQYAGIYQSVPVTAGETYEASAWFMKWSADPIQAPTTLDVRLTFRDGANVDIGGPVISTPLAAAAMAPDTWTQLSVQAVAPAGAESVEFLMFMINPTNAGGAMYADDASLVMVPEPAVLGLSALGVVGLLRRRSA